MRVPELQRRRKLQKSVSEREVEGVKHQMGKCRERGRKVSGWRGIEAKQQAAESGMKGVRGCNSVE